MFSGLNCILVCVRFEEVIDEVLAEDPGSKMLIFTSTKRMADMLRLRMKDFR